MNINSVEMVKEETDDLYHNYNRINRHCIYLMYKCKTNNEYPDKVDGAFGG